MKNKLNDLDPKTWLKFQKSWFIHNPPPRRKGVVVHPAKFPETMAQEFIEFFTRRGETVLDPMAGTGSALVAALRCGRNSYGIELNPKYAMLARQIIAEEKESLGDSAAALTAEVITGDAAGITDYTLPVIDFVITSPPYWDMLHARGAGTQKKRRVSADLDVFYSDDPHDLGNILDYEEFLQRLVAIYGGLKPRLREKAYLTIIVKNIKKGGRIYPLAWDLGRELGKVYTLKDEKIWCLPPGQKIWTQNGLREIELVQEGDSVLTHIGSLQKVNKVMNRQHHGQLIMIKTSLLGKTVAITPDHEILAIQRRKYVHKNGEEFRENSKRSFQRGVNWIPAQELKIRDLVAFPIPNTVIDLLELKIAPFLPEVEGWFQDDSWYYTRGRGKQGRGKLPKSIPINKDFMRLAGWYLSEGSAGVSGVNIANISTAVQDEMVQLFRSVFDVSIKTDRKGVWCRSRSIAKLLIGLFGKGAHNKKIPDFIFHLPQEKQIHLLQALWAGDGHIRENRVSYKTVSEELALGIIFLTARMGTMPYFQRNSKYFSLNYRGQSMRKMQELLCSKSLSTYYMRDQHWLHDNIIWLPVREITVKEYEGIVYNLEVDVDNSYMTEGFVVHNCQDNQRLAPYGLGSAWVSNTFHHYCLQFRNE